jgi:hypothetical protein
MDELTKRYGGALDDALDPRTMCTGDCEGTGWVPVKADDPDPEYRRLWHVAEQLSKTDDLYHFVPCPRCHGTGKRTA